jgi:adenine-specific DNA-methyltransferase
VIFSFYNSLTLLFAELEGRYYGGGVLELTPSEFKNLPLPYIQISDNVYRDFANHFADKNDISDILNVVDASVLTEALGLTQEDIDRLGVLRNRLVRRRLKL